MKKHISEKHIEAIADKTITAIISIFGNCHCHIQGKVTGRLRDRFKTFVFTPTFPTMFFTFSVGDVEKIEITDKGIILSLNRNGDAPRPARRKKKKKPLPVVAAEPENDKIVDLNDQLQNAAA